MKVMKSAIGAMVVLLIATISLTATAEAQLTQIPRIGYLTIGSRSFTPARVEAFRTGLREVGYEEGRNLLIEWRFADGQTARQKAYAEELARLEIAVIVTAGPADTRAARNATKTIPIVMAQDPDPVSNGFIASLAHPGGNITGLATLSSEISGKQLELLKEVVPKLVRVAVIGSSNIPGQAQALKETTLAAAALGVQVQYLDVVSPKDIEKAFVTAQTGHADAALVIGSPVLNIHRESVIDLAAKARLPTTYTRPEFVESGGLMTYGASYNDLYRRAAAYVDKILKGARPAELPVEQPTKFEFIVNLQTAKQIGLTIPPHVLARADKIIR